MLVAASVPFAAQHCDASHPLLFTANLVAPLTGALQG
jgi:hypothetical protein